jgi:hypothetical protein
VKESSVPGAGLGLFAKKNIKAGSIVSFYPAHILGVEVEVEVEAEAGVSEAGVSEAGVSEAGVSEAGVEVEVSNQQQQQQQQVLLLETNNEQDRIYFAEHPPSGSSYLHATDQPIFNRPSILVDDDDDDVDPSSSSSSTTTTSCSEMLKNSPLYLDVNPNRDVSPAWVSQYINDGAIMTENTEAGVSDYYKKSTANKNCIHIPFGPSPILATVATKKIKKGEELFTSYGCVYWIGVLFEGQEGAPTMTGQIQKQIQDSAQDLFAAMNVVKNTYKNQAEALQSVFDNL